MIGMAHEVARKTLNLEDVRTAAVALPPRAEQSRILEAADDHESIIDANGEATDASARRLAGLRRSILRWAFEGRLVDQDPTDEPAAVLLERIRAERSSTSGSQSKPLRRSRPGAASPTSAQ
jgi:type I restriction enzyme S subunit